MISKNFEIYYRSIMHFTLLDIFRYGNIYIYIHIFIHLRYIKNWRGLTFPKPPTTLQGTDAASRTRWPCWNSLGQRSDPKDPKVKSQVPGNWGHGTAGSKGWKWQLHQQKFGFQETHWYKWGPQFRVKVAKVHIQIRLKQKEWGSNI